MGREVVVPRQPLGGLSPDMEEHHRASESPSISKSPGEAELAGKKSLHSTGARSTKPKFIIFWCLQRHKQSPQKLGFSPLKPCGKGVVRLLPRIQQENNWVQSPKRCGIHLEEAALPKESPKITLWG